ncbi:Ig-like domain-containing protein [Empedobacter falsenii]
MSNLRKIISAIVVMITCNLSAQTVIFKEDFGNHTTRVRSPYTPSGVGYFIFADPNTVDNPLTTGAPYQSDENLMARVIENGYYAVINPINIKDDFGGYQDWSWGNLIALGKDSDNTGAAIVVNAGGVLSTFYKRQLDQSLEKGHYYKLSYSIYVANSQVSIINQIISTSGNTLLGQNTKNFGNASSNWEEVSIIYYVPSTGSSTNLKYYISFVNGNATASGNDFAVDNIQIEDLGTTNPGGIIVDLNDEPTSEPKAIDDSKLNNVVGSTVSISVLDNDLLYNGTKATAASVDFRLFGIKGLTEYTVAGEGKWSYSSGILTFTPLGTFKGNPTPITYSILDKTYPEIVPGDYDYQPGSATAETNRAKVTVTYVGNPTAISDNYTMNAGTTTSFDVLENDTDLAGAIITKSDVNTILLIDPFNPLAMGTNSLVVIGEGTWTVDSSAKKLTFTPETGFTDAPTPIQYYFTDTSGNNSNKATVTITVTGGGTTPTPGTTCTKTPNTTTATSFTNVGISTMSTKLENWPTAIPNGFLALESSTKGFVITRTADVAKIVDAKEGMIVYDTTEKCVKLYNGTIWHCIEKSCNE